MNIIEIIKDVFDDMDQKYDNAFSSDRYRWVSSRRARKNASSYALMGTLCPNILGFLFGLAVTRFLEFTGIAYLILGIIGAVGIGTLYSILKQGISPKYALIRHIIVVTGVSLFFLVCMLLNKIGI